MPYDQEEYLRLKDFLLSKGWEVTQGTFWWHEKDQYNTYSFNAALDRQKAWDIGIGQED